MNNYLDSTQLTILLTLIFIFGACIGSFLNVIIWRLPRDQKITGRSKCPNCHHQLNGLDLIPVFSYLFSGGMCRYCKKPISSRYFIIEIFVGALFVLAVFLTVPTLQFTTLQEIISTIKFWFIFSVLFVVFVIDFEHYLILDKVIFPAIVVVLALNFLIYGTTFPLFLIDSIIGAIAGFLPFYLLWKLSNGRWMGLGDAKLGLFLGVIFGFPQIWICYFIAFLLGGAMAIPLLATGKKELSSKIPFGTFLTVSALLTIWFGVSIAHWYFGLIGWS